MLSVAVRIRFTGSRYFLLQVSSAHCLCSNPFMSIFGFTVALGHKLLLLVFVKIFFSLFFVYSYFCLDHFDRNFKFHKARLGLSSYYNYIFCSRALESTVT